MTSLEVIVIPVKFQISTVTIDTEQLKGIQFSGQRVQSSFKLGAISPKVGWTSAGDDLEASPSTYPPNEREQENSMEETRGTLREEPGTW